MTHCKSCQQPTSSLFTNGSGLMEPLCDECRAKPDNFAQGTQPGKETLATLQNRTEAQQALEEALCRHAAAVDCLRVLVQAFQREMGAGYTTPEQQAALREAKRLMKAVG